MTQETLLLTTSDNHVIAINLEYGNAAEKIRRVKQYQQLCENITYKDFRKKYNGFAKTGSYSGSVERDLFVHVDGKNTEFLAREINSFDFVKRPQDYKNNVKDNNYPSDIGSKPDTVHFDSIIDDNEIPELIKNLGFKVEPEDYVYDAKYNPITQKYEVNNFNPRRAVVNVSKRQVRIARNNYTFSKAEYNRLNNFIKDFEKKLSVNPLLSVNQYVYTIPNDKDRNLFWFYAYEKRIMRNRLLFLKHELTHIKNKVLLIGAGLKKNSKRLSIEDYYRLQVEDERSAYLSQVVNAVNAYLKKGDAQDFRMFDNESSELVKTLKKMPENTRFAYAQNPKNLLDVALNSFERNHRKYYDEGQFITNMKLEINSAPVSAEPDNNREDFFKRRSLLYRFQVYNPQTKGYEEKNFTPFIENSQEVQINSDNIAKIINPCSQILSRRLTEFNRDKSRGEVNPDLVEEAKALMRDNLKKSKLVSRVNGIEISDLVEERTPSLPNTPTPPVKPRNPAPWSSEIEAYWSKFDGYKEIANNEDEYYFKLNESKVRYTAKDKVQMGKDAQYDAYVKLLEEPSNKDCPVKFMDTLTKEQALKLYVACVKTNRKMQGAVPTDFKDLSLLKDIPAADLRKCRQSINHSEMRDVVVKQVQQARGRR